MNHRTSTTQLLAVACISYSLTLSAAQPINFGEETFDISAGVFLQNFDTNIQRQKQMPQCH